MSKDIRAAKRANTVGVKKNNESTEGIVPRSRRDEIIEASAECFAMAGYDATAMRDIAKKAGLLAGSIYYHFASKEEILIAVHEEAVRRIMERVRGAVDPEADSWDQLLQASAAYAETLVAERKFVEVVVTEFPRRRDKALRAVLVSHREQFEWLFRDIVEKLPLEPWVNRSLFRLSLLSQLAWVLVWYHENGSTPTEIATQMVNMQRFRTEGA